MNKREKARQLISKVLNVLPELKNEINYEMSELNGEVILITDTVRIPKEKYDALRKEGLDFTWGTVASCGIPQGFEKKIEEDEVLITVYPCWCHPYNYFLVITEVVG